MCIVISFLLFGKMLHNNIYTSIELELTDSFTPLTWNTVKLSLNSLDNNFQILITLTQLDCIDIDKVDQSLTRKNTEDVVKH